MGLLFGFVVCVGVLAYGIHQGTAGGHSPRVALVRPTVANNPCSLLTNGEAAAALGIRIQSRSTQLPPSMQAVPGSGFGMCTWTGARFANSGYEDNQVVVRVIPMSRARFQSAERATTRSVKLTGLGEAAYETTGPYYSVNVLSHGLAMTVAVYPSSSLQIEESLAKLAVARLP